MGSIQTLSVPCMITLRKSFFLLTPVSQRGLLIPILGCCFEIDATLSSLSPLLLICMCVFLSSIHNVSNLIGNTYSLYNIWKLWEYKRENKNHNFFTRITTINMLFLSNLFRLHKIGDDEIILIDKIYYIYFIIPLKYTPKMFIGFIIFIILIFCNLFY